MRRPSSLSWLALAALLVGPAACKDSAGSNGSSGRAAPSASAAPSSDVLATVNGVPIRVGELHYVLARKKAGRHVGTDAAAAKAALEELVDQEIARQAATTAGLDADPDYQKKLRFMEAPFVQFQREELGNRYLRRQLAEKTRVDDADLRKYFDAHAAELKTELHLWQILVRNDEAKIRELKKQIDGGAAFETVAATLFPPNLPAGSNRPWDLGVMRWTQVPAQWRAALEKMKDGEVSDVIAGPKGRFWVVKLVKRQSNEALGFEQLKPEIAELLRGEKGSGLGQKTKAELRKKAAIVYVREAGAVPPPPEPED